MSTAVASAPQTPTTPDARYPRPGWFRGFRLLFRLLWLLLLLAGIAFFVPNAVSVVQSKGFAGLTDPNNLARIFDVNQITGLAASNPIALYGGAGAGAVIFIAAIVLAVLSGADARRERRALRAGATQAVAALPAAPVLAAAPTLPPPPPAGPPPSPMVATAAASQTPPPAAPVRAWYSAPASQPVDATPDAAAGAAAAALPDDTLPDAVAPGDGDAAASVAGSAAALAVPLAEPVDQHVATPMFPAATPTPSNTPFGYPTPEPSANPLTPYTPAPSGPNPSAQPASGPMPYTPPSSAPLPYTPPTSTPLPYAPPASGPIPYTPPAGPSPYAPPAQAQGGQFAFVPYTPPPAPPAAPPAGGPLYGAPPAFGGAPSQYPPPYPHPASPSTPLRQAAERARAATSPVLDEAMQRTRAYWSSITQPPAVDPTSVSPVEFVAKTPGWARATLITDRQLGFRLDGWADTVEDMAAHAPKMVEALVSDLPTHFRPAVHAVSARFGVTGLSTLAQGKDIPVSFGAFVTVFKAIAPAFKVLPRVFLRIFGVKIVGKQRDYLFAVTTPGAVTTLSVTATGKDLYMAWDLFLRRVWNEIAIGLVMILALAVGIFAGFQAGLGVVKLYAAYGGHAPLNLILLGFIGAFILSGALSAASVIVLTLALGWLFRRDPLAFFIKDIDLFEAHDVQAMVLGVHKAMLNAADKAGVDVKLLRAKEEFRVGRRNRII